MAGSKRIRMLFIVGLMAALIFGPTWWWAINGMSSKIGWAWTWTTILGEPFLGWALFMLVTEPEK